MEAESSDARGRGRAVVPRRLATTQRHQELGQFEMKLAVLPGADPARGLRVDQTLEQDDRLVASADASHELRGEVPHGTAVSIGWEGSIHLECGLVEGQGIDPRRGRE